MSWLCSKRKIQLVWWTRVLTSLMGVNEYRYQTKLQRQQMKNKDQRTSIMSEILSNIRYVLK